MINIEIMHIILHKIDTQPIKSSLLLNLRANFYLNLLINKMLVLSIH
jgi:hypothetical protein